MTSHNAKCYSKICDGRSSKSGTLGKEWLNTVYNNHRGYTLLKWHTQIIKCCTGLQPQIIKLVIYWAAWTGRQAGICIIFWHNHEVYTWLLSIHIDTYNIPSFYRSLAISWHITMHDNTVWGRLKLAILLFSQDFNLFVHRFFFFFFSVFCNWAS